MTRNSKQNIDSFKQRLALELDNMKLKNSQKEIILDLVDIEIKDPTSDKDFYDRYMTILERSGEFNKQDA